MSTASLADIAALLDATLRVREIKDAPVALNGLQVENSGRVSRVALAVDASQETLDGAVAAGADLLLVHHGLFWQGLRPLTGWWKRKIETCLRHDLAVYSAHLPLDVHPELGNNACIARLLGLEDAQPALFSHGLFLGVGGRFDGSARELRERYADITGAAVRSVLRDADAPAGRVAVCSGGAAGEVFQAAEEGFDCLLSGEELHWAATGARDVGVNLLLAGHYATETFGVKALGRMLEERFGLPVLFIDNPTGM